MVKNGLFITVEGGEGVGKSTNIATMASLLEGLSIPLVLTREPGGTVLAERLRGLLLDIGDEQVDPITELLMMFAARRQHLCEVIEPALSQGKWVICDRFTDATYAYQGGGRGMSSDLIETLENIVQGDRRPDLTVLLDAPVSVGMERARNRGNLDRFEREKLDFFDRVRQTYRQRAEADPSRFKLVSADQDLIAVQAEITTIMQQVTDQWMKV